MIKVNSDEGQLKCLTLFMQGVYMQELTVFKQNIVFNKLKNNWIFAQKVLTNTRVSMDINIQWMTYRMKWFWKFSVTLVPQILPRLKMFNTHWFESEDSKRFYRLSCEVLIPKLTAIVSVYEYDHAYLKWRFIILSNLILNFILGNTKRRRDYT